jgi:anti-sigma regulatory factor (Ser/Thr protein kinase)
VLVTFSTPRRVAAQRRQDQGMRRWRVRPTANCLPALRREVHNVALSWGMKPDEINDLLIIVTELVSNVVEHAGTSFRVTVRSRPHMVRVLVSDLSPTGPVMAEPIVNGARCRGLGMHIVAALARRWGWSQHPTGKTVWATMDRTHG